ncbi:MAG: HAD hydrolase-like protein [Clostridia bacterium]|nr:HAD hydrolase-like protein [Clostridia bacterium]
MNRPSECVMIGDHLELDINGAKKCGINTIWVNSKNIENNNIQTISVDNINEFSQYLIESLTIDIER